MAAQEHQHFVLDAAAGVGGELDFLRRVESVDGFNQADRADGNEILQHDAGVVELPGDKDNEAEIVFNQRRADGSAVGVEPGEKRLFLCRCQRGRQGFRAADVVNLARRKAAQQGGKLRGRGGNDRTQGGHIEFLLFA